MDTEKYIFKDLTIDKLKILISVYEDAVELRANTRSELNNMIKSDEEKCPVKKRLVIEGIEFRGKKSHVIASIAMESIMKIIEQMSVKQKCEGKRYE
jgi:hypothetical protein